MNRTRPLALSMMKNRNGWSALADEHPPLYIATDIARTVSHTFGVTASFTLHPNVAHRATVVHNTECEAENAVGGPTGPPRSTSRNTGFVLLMRRSHCLTLAAVQHAARTRCRLP